MRQCTVKRVFVHCECTVKRVADGTLSVRSSTSFNQLSNMWHVIGNSWGVGQDGVGGLGLGPQEHFRWKMMLMRRTMVTVNKNVKGEIQKHHLYADAEILDWNTEASLRGCGNPNTKSPRACADISIGGSVIVLPTLPPPTLPPVTGKIFSYTLIIFCRILKAKYWSHKVRLPTITTSINKTPNHSSPPGRLVPSPWQFSRPRWFFLSWIWLQSATFPGAGQTCVAVGAWAGDSSMAAWFVSISQNLSSKYSKDL